MLSFNDMMLDFGNVIQGNQLVNSMFGNVIVASMVILLAVMIVYHINDGMVSRLVYGFIAVFCCLLIVTKLIKLQYTTKSDTELDNKFSTWMQSNASKPLVITKKQMPSDVLGSSDPPIDFIEAEDIMDVTDVDVDNFLYGQSSS